MNALNITTVLKQARDALTTMNVEQGMATIEAIDEVLELKANPTASSKLMAQDGPVAWFEQTPSGKWFLAYTQNPDAKTEPLYTIPPSAKQAAEQMRKAMLEYLVDAEIIDKDSAVYRTLANQPIELILV